MKRRENDPRAGRFEAIRLSSCICKKQVLDACITNSLNSQTTVGQVRRQRPEENLHEPGLKLPRPIRLDQSVKILRPCLLEVTVIDVAKLVPRRATQLIDQVSALCFPKTTKAVRSSGSNLAISNSLARCIRRPVLVETDEAIDVGVDKGERVVKSDLLKGDDVRQADVGLLRVELDRCIVRVHLPEVRQVPGVEQEGLCGESVADLLVG